MNDIQNYTLVTTIAISLLVLTQIIFLTFLIIVLARLKKAADNFKQTSQMSKDFVKSLREKQLNQESLWKIGLYAFQRAKATIKQK